MKAWTLYLPSVLPDVNTCPQPIAVQAVRDTAIDFCTDSRIWQETQPAYYLTAGGVSYDLDADVDTRVQRIIEASIAGSEIAVLSVETCDRLYPGWRFGLAGTPEAVTQMQPDQFSVLPQPTSTTAIVLSVVLVPTRDATEGPDFLFDEFYDVLCAGAKARLMLMKDKPWSNPALGAGYAAFTAKAISQARLRRESIFGQPETEK